MENIEGYAEWFFSVEALRAMYEKHKNLAKSSTFAEFPDIVETTKRRIESAEQKLLYICKEHVLFNFIKETLKKKQLNARTPFYQIFCFEQRGEENVDLMVRVFSFLNYEELLLMRLVSQTFSDVVCSPYFYHCLYLTQKGIEYNKRSIALQQEAKVMGRRVELTPISQDKNLQKLITVKEALVQKLSKNAEAQKFYAEDVKKLMNTVNTTARIGQKMRERIKDLAQKLFSAREELKEQKLKNIKLKSAKQTQEFEFKLQNQKLEKKGKQLDDRIVKLKHEHDALQEKIEGQRSLIEYQKQFLDKLQTFVLHDCDVV